MEALKFSSRTHDLCALTLSEEVAKLSQSNSNSTSKTQSQDLERRSGPSEDTQLEYTQLECTQLEHTPPPLHSQPIQGQSERNNMFGQQRVEGQFSLEFVEEESTQGDCAQTQTQTETQVLTQKEVPVKSERNDSNEINDRNGREYIEDFTQEYTVAPTSSSAGTNREMHIDSGGTLQDNVLALENWNFRPKGMRARYLNRTIRKRFGGQHHTGTIVKYDELHQLYYIKYDDDDEEEMDEEGVLLFLLPSDVEFFSDLSQTQQTTQSTNLVSSTTAKPLSPPPLASVADAAGSATTSPRSRMICGFDKYGTLVHGTFSTSSATLRDHSHLLGREVLGESSRGVEKKVGQRRKKQLTRY